MQEAAELAYFGAKILHPVAMRPAQKAGIPVRIKNSYNPDHPGTIITGSRVCGEKLVTAITFKEGGECTH
jgi:aspartate kinase